MGKKNNIDDLRKQAKSYMDDLDLSHLMDSIDFNKVDMNRIKDIDFSGGIESARHQLDQLPKLRLTTQQDIQEKEEGGFVGGVLLGVVLGAIIALLFAPKSGSETRDEIVHAVEDVKQKVSGDVEEASNEAEKVAEDIKEDVLPDEPAIERNFG